jgi:hypothetical protein
MPNQIDEMTLEQMSCLIDSVPDESTNISNNGNAIPTALIIAQLESLAKERAAKP